MADYKVKENHRIGKSVNVCLYVDDKVVYDRYVSTGAWGIDPDEVTAEIIAYWEKETSKIPDSVIITEAPVEVIMTSDEALVKNIAVAVAKIAAEKALADEQVEAEKIEVEGK